MLVRCAALAIFAAACSPIVARPGVIWHEAPGDVRVEPDPITAAADAAAAAAGHAPIALAGGAGSQELRIWTGFGLQGWLSYVRIVVDSASVRGEHLLAWDEPDDERCGEQTRYVLDLHACAEVRTAGRTVACALATTGIDWRALLHRLERRDVWNLRDDAFFPASHMTDGVCLAVALRDGARWRRYTLCNPRDHADADHANAIIEMVDSLALPPVKRMPWDPPPPTSPPTFCGPPTAETRDEEAPP